jgi:hypothetical protein
MGGSGGGGSIGTGGTAGVGGPDAGAGGDGTDGPQDLPLGTGGTADANRDVATSPGTDSAGGAAGPGGSDGGAGGVAGAGGVTSSGGSGGASGVGGKTGTGGATGKGGSSGIDGGTAQNLCAYECRTDSSGVTGWYSGSKLLCTADCLGCRAICSGVGTRDEGCFADCGAGCGTSPSPSLIAYTTCGELPGDTGYLAWQAPGTDGTGPAVVVKGIPGSGGSIQWWTNTDPFPPETPPYSATTASKGLTRIQVSDLFRRLAAVDMASLPHEPLPTNGCSGSLYLRPCDTCTPTTLTYASPESLTPEMESVWSWFDTILGVDSQANPRCYCLTVGADP